MTASAVALPAIQRTPEWIEARYDGIGASEAAAALGLSRWESKYEKWCQKCRLVPPKDPTLAMRLGTELEPFIASLYTEATGIPLRRVNRLLQSKTHPWMLASLDRRRPDGIIVEIKWTDRGEGYGEPGTDEIPDDVLCQVVHQMAVTGAPAAEVAVIRGGRFERYGPILRDPEAEAALIDGERAFWTCVETRTAPALDGSASDQRALESRWPQDSGDVLTLSPGHPAADALAALREVRALKDRATADEARLRAVIEAEMGEASGITVPGVGKVTWKAPKPAAATDWPAVARALGDAVPDLFPALVDAHTTTKTSTRRFVPSWEEVA